MNRYSVGSGDLPGLLILGADSGCGKTAIITGLAMALNESGFRVQALKPIDFSASYALSKGHDQKYMNLITQQYIQVETLVAESPWDISVPQWNRMIEQCRTLQYPVLLEGAGQIGSPWQISQQNIRDGIDVAQDLGLPILVIGKGEPAFLAKMRAALSYLASRGTQPIGFIRIETSPTSEDMDLVAQHETLIIGQHYMLPCLGILPYSPSISVAGLQQGNLLRLTQEHIDLLPIQMGIGLKV